jgi:glycosyltransferase involved in cell wall biosynthesis
LRIGMCPDPFILSDWSRLANPHLYWLAEAIQSMGAEIVGLLPWQVRNPHTWKQMNLDVIHLHWPAAVFNFRVRREPLQRIIPHTLVQKWVQHRLNQWEQAVRKAGVPLVWEVHDTLSHHAYGYNYAADFALHEKFYRLAAGVLLHGESCYPPVKELYGAEKIHETAPLGSFRGLYGPPISRAAALHALGLSCTGKVFSYLGTARPMRNAEASVSAFIKLAGPKDLLLIAGGGVEKYLPEHLDQRINVYSGVIPPELFLQLICASDFTLNDARHYLTSAIIRVAMSYACPVVAYPYGSALDIARDAAIWIPEAEDGLETAIRLALQMSENDRQKLCSAAVVHEQDLTWQACGHACQRMYQRVLK